MTSRIGSRPAIPVVTIVELFRFAAAGSEIVVVVTVAIGMTIRSIEPPALIPAMPLARAPITAFSAAPPSAVECCFRTIMNRRTPARLVSPVRSTA
ncbi:MAG: hypothetical protein IRY89_06855 [Pseudolabrys sp.]|nr:hypothetical protein [Pseudolabrys sp.]